MAENGNSFGIVGTLIAGIGLLIFVVFIVFALVSTISNANLLRSTAQTTTVLDESGFINTTGYTLANFDGSNYNFVIVKIANASAGGGQILSGNWTFNQNTGKITNATATVWPEVAINYTYVALTGYEVTTNSLSSNLTGGVNNVSGKIPTILLIGAVVLLLGVLAILVKYSETMGFGRQGSL